MLQNAVYPVPDLHAVKTQADQFKTQTRKDLDYDQYSHLLLSAASTYDAQFVPKATLNLRSSRPVKRAIYAHDIDEFYDAAPYDINSSVDVIEANAHDHSPVEAFAA